MLMRPRFALGELYATPGVIQALKGAMLSAGIYLGRHLSGDWGDVDREDWDANNRALEEGGRVCQRRLKSCQIADVAPAKWTGKTPRFGLV